MIAQLELLFERLVRLQYNTSVPSSEADVLLRGHLHKDVYFRDPWQAGGGLAAYRLGLRGFHAMFSFHWENLQLHATLNEDGSRARVLCDGWMHVRAARGPSSALLDRAVERGTRVNNGKGLGMNLLPVLGVFLNLIHF